MRSTGEIWVAFTMAAMAVALGALLSLRLAGQAQPAGQARAAQLERPGRAGLITAAEAGSSGDAAQSADASGNHEESQSETAEEDDKLSQELIEKRKEELSAEQNYVCFQKGTEPAFSGKYYDNHEHGMYICVVCANPLFESDTKFDSGTGWPSFWEMAEEGHVAKHEDRSHGMTRTEVTCANCGSHLGHVFDDGPKPTGLRYCINSLSLDFIPAEEWARRQAEAGAGSEEPAASDE